MPEPENLVRRLPLDELLYVSPRRAALLCDGIAPARIRDAIREGKIIAWSVGMRSLIRVADLHAWFDQIPITQSTSKKE